MSTLKVLKEYLVGEGGYLLNDDNNGKTVMLSGAWGSGKTHFWKNDIVPELVKNFKDTNHASVYISLYGKESLKAIKQEVFLKASDEKDYLSEEVETFGIDALSSLKDSDANWAKIVKSFWDLNKTRRGQKGQNKLKDGGLICFDDFERKSKKVDLNDLFGFISQLAIGLNCKVVIILNSDVFEGEEANIFKTVKEKTVNKFFYFEPTLEELFNSIYESDKKYKKLDKYKTEILKAVKETKELNARIYIQVLDNCLEWIEKGYDQNVLRVVVFITVFFIKYHVTLAYTENDVKDRIYEVSKVFLNSGYKEIYRALNSETDFKNSVDSAIVKIYDTIHEDKDNEGSEDFYKKQNEVIDANKDLISDFVRYIYNLKIDKDIEFDLFTQINNYVKTGVLIKQIEEASL